MALSVPVGVDAQLERNVLAHRINHHTVREGHFNSKLLFYFRHACAYQHFQIKVQVSLRLTLKHVHRNGRELKVHRTMHEKVLVRLGPSRNPASSRGILGTNLNPTPAPDSKTLERQGPIGAQPVGTLQPIRS